MTDQAAFLAEVMDDLLRPYAGQDEDSARRWLIDRLMGQSLASLARQVDRERLAVEACLDQLRGLGGAHRRACDAIWRAEAHLEWIALVREEIGLQRPAQQPIWAL